MTSSQQSQSLLAKTVPSRPSDVPVQQATGKKVVGATLDVALLKHIGGGATPVRGW